MTPRHTEARPAAHRAGFAYSGVQIDGFVYNGFVTKTCTKCREEKPLTDFYRKAREKDGYAGNCKSCANAARKRWEQANPDKLRERTYRWRAKYPEKHQAVARRSQLKLHYGITVDQYEARLKLQGGRCAICRTDEPGGRWGTFSVDHDHSCCAGKRSCGKCLRGLLCSRCNTVLGMVNDRIDVLKSALEYLRGIGHGFQ